eukprot:7219418-Pyramimonas_sp.AAC.1
MGAGSCRSLQGLTGPGLDRPGSVDPRPGAAVGAGRAAVPDRRLESAAPLLWGRCIREGTEDR